LRSASIRAGATIAQLSWTELKSDQAPTESELQNMKYEADNSITLRRRSAPAGWNQRLDHHPLVVAQPNSFAICPHSRTESLNRPVPSRRKAN
jgi:hypothetical protein